MQLTGRLDPGTKWLTVCECDSLAVSTNLSTAKGQFRAKHESAQYRWKSASRSTAKSQFRAKHESAQYRWKSAQYRWKSASRSTAKSQFRAKHESAQYRWKSASRSTANKSEQLILSMFQYLRTNDQEHFDRCSSGHSQECLVNPSPETLLDVTGRAFHLICTCCMTTCLSILCIRLWNWCPEVNNCCLLRLNWWPL